MCDTKAYVGLIYLLLNKAVVMSHYIAKDRMIGRDLEERGSEVVSRSLVGGAEEKHDSPFWRSNLDRLIPKHISSLSVRATDLWDTHRHADTRICCNVIFCCPQKTRLPSVYQKKRDNELIKNVTT